MARASHMRIAMHNNTNFEAISLENLHPVTGGYHDADPPTPAPPVLGGAIVGSVIGDVLRQLSVGSAPAQ